MKLLDPSSWKDYELLDCGDFEKLERFGKYTLIRPEPQAIWRKVLTDQEWKKLADAKFVREQKDKFRFTDDVKGGWSKNPSMPESWNINYKYNSLDLTLRLALTGFGHVGIFPEQGNNWNFIYDTIKSWKIEKPKVLKPGTKQPNQKSDAEDFKRLQKSGRLEDAQAVILKRLG